MVTNLYSNGPIMPCLSPELFKKYLSGEIRMYWHDSLILAPMNKAERLNYDMAVKSGYYTSKGKRGMGGAAYYYYCELNDRPFIELRPNRKYTTIEIDFITVMGSKGIPEDTLKELLDPYYDALKPKSLLGLGGCFSYFHIRNDVANEIARKLVALTGIETGRC